MKVRWKIIFVLFIGITSWELVKFLFFSLFELAKINEAIPNLFDFFGNIVISISSAIIAYIVSRWQIHESEIKESLKLQRENNGNIQLLIQEIEFNITVLKTVINYKNYTPLRQISSMIWDRFFYRIEISEKLFKDMYSVYRDIGMLKNDNESELNLDNENIEMVNIIIDELNNVVIQLKENIIEMKV